MREQPPQLRAGPSAYPGEPGIGPDYQPPFAPYDAATAWLFSLNRFGIRPGLARIAKLLEELGHPERRVGTIVVAELSYRYYETPFLRLKKRFAR